MIVAAGAGTADDFAQFEDEQGRLFTVFSDMDGYAEELRDGLRTTPEGRAVLRLASVSACWVECRWEAMFTEWIRGIAAELSGAAWLLDGDDVLWLATHVDPERITL